MPVSFSSAARNLFLLGSSGADVVTNFFKAIDQSSVAEEYLVKGIKYTEYDEQYIIAGKAENSSNVKHGWVSKRQDSGSETWGVTLNAITGQDLILTDIHLDVNGKLIVIGSVETSVTERIPFISRYTGNGVREWQSTSNTANVKYNGVATDADGNCYVCGNTQVSGDAQAFIEKFDADGNPGWGKSAINLQSDVLLSAIDIDTKGYVIAGGYVQDTNNEYKGYFVKLDTETGQVVWDRTLDITDRDWGSIPVVEIKDVKIDGNDFIYIVGTQFAGISGNSAGFICKYNPEGNMLWQRETPIDPPNFGRWRYNCVEVDTDTGQIVILGSYFENTSDEYGVLVKYSDKGDKIFTRVIESTEENPPEFGNLTSLRGGMALDASASFYYVAFTDQDSSNVNGTPDKYTYGKVSSSGNGLGDFSYETGDLNTIEYYIQDLGDRIGRLSDGSVRYDTSDLATNILNPTRIMFDDFATPVTNKKRQMNIGGSFAYSGSPAVRPADFQELNLSGDVEIRTEETAGTITSAFWKDQSGKGNDGEVEVTDTLKEPHPGFGSVKFDGSNDYLSMPDSQILEILDADFTVEFWIYPTGVPQGQFACIFSKGINVQCYFMNTNSISLFLDDNNNGSPYGVFENSNLTGTNSVPLNQWSHVAICRDGSTFKAFVNGVEEYTNSIPGLNPVFNSADDFSIGDYGASPGTYNFQGYISNFRFLKGTALYLADFTVPTTPLTSTGSDTSLLTCQGTGAIVDARTGTPNVITANGGVATSKLETAPSLNAAGYWEFNGTPGVGDGDTINLGDTSTYKWIHDRSASDWAIEGWFWSNIDEEYAAMISNNSGTSSVGFYMGLRNDELFECVINKGTFGTPACKVLSTDILDQNRWYHIAFVNENYTVKLYIDGVLQSNAGDQNSFSAGSTADAQTDLRIGKLGTSSQWNLNGRIGGLRIYKRPFTEAQAYQNYNSTKEQYTGERPITTPRISDGVIYETSPILYYDFRNRFCYDVSLQNYIGSSDFDGSTLTSADGSYTEGWTTTNAIKTQVDDGPYDDKVSWELETNSYFTAKTRSYTTLIQPSVKQKYCFSVYVKQGTGEHADRIFFQMRRKGFTADTSVDNDKIIQADWYWDSKTFVGTGNDPAEPILYSEEIGNGWWRLAITTDYDRAYFNAGSSPVYARNYLLEVDIHPASKDYNDEPVGMSAIGKTIYYGPQIELSQNAQGIPSPYVKRDNQNPIKQPLTINNIMGTSYSATCPTGYRNGVTNDPGSYGRYGAAYIPEDGSFSFYNHDEEFFSDRIEVGTQFIQGNNPWSISMWVKTEPHKDGINASVERMHVLMAGTEHNGSGLVLVIDKQKATVPFGEPDYIECSISLGVGNSQIFPHDLGSNLTASTTFADETWTLTTWTWDGTTLKAYTNGSADGSTTSISFNITGSTFLIGAGERGTASAYEFANNPPYIYDSMHGWIADVLVYDRAITSAEVSSIYNATRGKYGV